MARKGAGNPLPTKQPGSATGGTLKLSSGMELVFRPSSKEKIPALRPGGNKVNQYQPLMDALKAMPEGQPLELPVPATAKAQTMVQNILSSVRRHLPETRSRVDSSSTPAVIYLWLDKEAAAKARKKGSPSAPATTNKAVA